MIPRKLTHSNRPKSPCRILVCDDLEMIRSAIQPVLCKFPEFQLVDEAATGMESIAKAILLQPDLILMDVHLPDLDGAETTRQILLGSPGTRVLAYSSDSAWETAERMIIAGARGYVVKGLDENEVIRAARAVLAGRHYFSLVLLEPTISGKNHQ
jgi:two-component system, NarL family, response regulator DevR